MELQVSLPLFLIKDRNRHTSDFHVAQAGLPKPHVYMEAQIKLGRIFGVEIGLHYSWLIIAFLITLSLASHLQMTNAQWGSGVI